MITVKISMEEKKVKLESGLGNNQLTLSFDSKQSIKKFVKLMHKHCITITFPAYIEGIGQIF